MKDASRSVTDEQIVKAFQQSGNVEKGFRLLMEAYNEKLYWTIRRIVVDHEDANDVLQNTLVKIFKNIHRFKGNSSLYTWLYRIVTNESLTFLKKRKRRAVNSIDDEESHLAHQLTADPFFDGDELQIQLQKILEGLPEKQRVVFNMRYYEEMPYKQMAEILDTSVGALKASYHHAAKKIETQLKMIEI